jgi:hypothetical protein
LICKLIKAQARIPENKENKIENEPELSKLTTAPPKDTAAFDNNNVFAAGGPTRTSNKTKDNKVIPEPIDDRKFQE